MNRRLRQSALIAGGVVIIVLVGVALMLRGGADGRASTQTTWNVTAPTTVPAGSRLVPTATQEVVSPVTASGQPAAAELTWQSGPDELDVGWGGPMAPQTSGDPNLAPQGRAAQQGYTVTTAAQLISETNPAVSIASTNVSVSGRPAVMSVSSAPPSVGLGVQADRWVSWRLGEGRYLHVWRAYADEPTLLAFAATFTERSLPLPRYLAVGVMAPGLPEQFVDGGPGFYGVRWCPTGLQMPQFDQGSDHCVGVYLTHATDAYRQGIMIHGGPDVTADTLLVHTGGHQGYALPTDNVSISVGSADEIALTSTEIAAIIGSTRYDPAIPIRPDS